VVLLAVGCDKGDKSPDKADKAGTTAAKPAPAKAAKKVSASAKELAKWKTHSNTEHGYAVRGPGAPKLLAIPEQPGVSVVSYMYEFSDGSGAGQVSVMKFEPAGKGDAALIDNACKGMVQGVNGKMTKYDEIEVDGKPARSFTFKAFTQGRNVRGMGRCIATTPTALKIVMAFHLGKSEELVQAFVDSFELTAG
jgi:hypothetical protein